MLLLRTIWVMLVALCVTIPCGLAVIAIALVRSTSPLIDWVIRFWAKTIVRSGGITLTAEGLERMDMRGRYILVANHYSYFDIPCILAAIPQPIRFMAKASLFRVPIFGWAIGKAGFIPVDRKNRSKAKQSFDLAAARIRKGNTIVVFPEEGRTSAREMRPFKRGGFLLALKSQLPVLPIAVDGTFELFPVGARLVRRSPVTVRIGTPIITSEMSVRDRDRLEDEAREQIETMLYRTAANE